MEHLENNNNEVLQQMAKYKFDEPLNVTVIHEDLDDDELISVPSATKKYDDTNLTHATNSSSTISEISHKEYIIDRNTSTIELRKKSVEDNVISNDANIFNNSNNTYECLLTSLDTLSENLIRISQAGFKTNFFRSNQQLYDKAKKYYLYDKIKIFKASFHIAANVILPQENNRSFLERFISGTVSIARCKSLECISKEIIYCLLIDLIKWTKHEIRRFNTRMSNTHLNYELNQNTTARNVQYPRYNRLEENITNISNSRKHSLSPNSHWGRQLYNNTNSFKPNTHHVHCSNSDNFPNSDDSSITSPKRLKGNDNIYQVQLNTHNNVSDHQYRLQSQNEHAEMNSTLVSPTSKSMGQESWNELRINDSVDQYILLRSVSRDSGIESPTCSIWQPNNPMEAMYENATRNSAENVNMAPSMTSKNISTNTRYMFETYCNVCQKPTKDVCNGCERQFYCSLECQTVDWNVHKYFCIR